MVKTICHPSYSEKQSFINKLVSTFFTEGKTLVKGSRNIIKTFETDAETYNIKYFKKPSFIKALVYSYFRKSKAQRSFEYATYLINNKIKTPFPIAFIENRNFFGILKDSYYVCQHINYDFTIRELIHNPRFENREEILKQFARFTFQLHEANVNFLDHSPGNTLIVKGLDGNYIFYLIDLNRMKFEKLSLEQRLDNFKKMWLSKTMVLIIAEKYAELSGENGDKVHQILQQKTSDFKRKITRKKYLKRKIRTK